MATPVHPLRRLGRSIVDSRITVRATGLVSRLLPPARVAVTRHTVVVRDLPARLDGLRILHLSDLHVHPGSDLAWQLPALVASTAHDLLLYTGDFIDTDDDIPSVGRLLTQVPHTSPAFTVLGNHDYIPFGRTLGANDVARLRTILAARGLDVLTNETRILYDGGLAIVGIDDPSTGRDDLSRAMAAVPQGAATVVLAHSPDIVLRLGAHRPGLILAGHTHGGQIRLPRIGALITLSSVPRHLAMGLGSYDDVPLFVTRGIGYSGLNLRIGSPAEAALLTLRSPEVVAGPGREQANAPKVSLS